MNPCFAFNKKEPNPDWVEAPYEVSGWTPERGFFIDTTPPPSFMGKTLSEIAAIPFDDLVAKFVEDAHAHATQAAPRFYRTLQPTKEQIMFLTHLIATGVAGRMVNPMDPMP